MFIICVYWKQYAKAKGGFKGGISLLHSATAVRLMLNKGEYELRKDVVDRLAGGVVSSKNDPGKRDIFSGSSYDRGC